MLDIFGEFTDQFLEAEDGVALVPEINGLEEEKCENIVGRLHTLLDSLD